MTNYSIEELALFGNLANNSYTETNPNGFVQSGTDYTLTNQTYDSASSFGGQAYYSATDNRLVVSYQGTSSSGDLLLTDLFGPGLGWTGGFTNQSAAARVFTEQALQSVSGTNAEVVFVGHSLGGFLAQENLLFSEHSNVNAVVFNSPGVGGLSAEFTGGAFIPTDTNTTYVYTESWGFAAPIHGIGARISDNVYFVPGTSGHGIAGLLSDIESAGITLYSDVPSLTAALETEEITFQEVIEALDSIDDPNAQNLLMEAITGAENNCFGREVPIDMWPLDPDLKPGPDGMYDQDAVRAKIWKKPIELIRVGDIVVSFDDNDNLVPGPVTRTFQNNAKILLDFHGTRVTPGHVYYRPDSKKSYKYETLIDVLRDDGVIKHQDGTLIRAATNVPVESPRDGFVRAVAGTRNTDDTFEQKDEGRIRLGTRFLVGTGKERKSWAVADLIERGGGIVGDDELIRVDGGEPMPFLWDFGETLPKPEDFVLACSGTTLEDIYKAAEWESQGPRLPAPMVLDRGPVQPLKGAALSAMPRNEPLDVVHSPMASVKPQRVLNRKQRKAMEAKQRKAAKSRKRVAI